MHEEKNKLDYLFDMPVYSVKEVFDHCYKMFVWVDVQP
jgi:hypothetical protein